MDGYEKELDLRNGMKIYLLKVIHVLTKAAVDRPEMLDFNELDGMIDHLETLKEGVKSASRMLSVNGEDRKQYFLKKQAEGLGSRR